MQIRCYSCGTPFNLKKEVIHAALDSMVEDDQNHFNAHCPRCRKANRVARQRLAKAAPTWVAPSEGEAEEADEEIEV